MKSSNLGLNLGQISPSPLDILLGLHQEDLLLLVVLLDSFRQGVLSVLEHFDHELQFLVQLREGILLLLHELLFNLNDVILKDLALLQACLNLLR